MKAVLVGSILRSGSELPWQSWIHDKGGLRRLVIVLTLVVAAIAGPHASWLGLATGAAMIAAVVIALRPEWWLMAIVLASAIGLDRAKATSSPNLVMVVLAGLTAWQLAAMVLQRERLSPDSEALRPWLALVAISGLSIVVGGAQWNPWVVVKDNFVLVQLAQLSIFVLSAAAFWLSGAPNRTRLDLQRMVSLMLIFSVFLIAQVLIPSVTGRLSSITLNGVVFRICAACLAGAAAIWMVELLRWQRIALAVLAFAVPVGGFITSRSWQSGWLPGLVALLTLLVLWRGRAWKRWVTLSTLPTALVVFGVIPHIAALDRWSLETRMVAWRGLIDLLQGRWIFGLGLASYWHYWRSIFGRIVYLDPTNHYLHFSYDPQVNMHNTYMDVLGQMGILGVLCLFWLLAFLIVFARRQFLAETDGFGKAYAAASVAILVGLSAAGMLADWVFPFVYNVGLDGFRDSLLGWLVLGGLVTLERTRTYGAGGADGA